MQRYKKSLYKKLTFEIEYNEINKTNLKNIIIVLFVFSENTIVEISRLQPFET